VCKPEEGWTRRADSREDEKKKRKGLERLETERKRENTKTSVGGESENSTSLLVKPLHKRQSNCL
jgi:hypothetical protein